MHHTSDAMVIAAYGHSPGCKCPECGTTSHRVHSRYPRMIADLPCAGRRIELHLTVRRFVCNVVHCRRKIFAERFGDGVIRPMARRTARLETLVYHLALALGGRPAARFADRLGLPGGLASIEDIKRMLQPDAAKLEGAISGRALYDGRIDPAEALALIKAAKEVNA